MSNNIIGIIPARWQSQRLPGKPLIDILGLPMVVRVWQNVIQSNLMSNVFVATDDMRIAEVCNDYKIPTIMTTSDLPSGTDRIEQAIRKLDIAAEIIVNIQGDEPLLKAEVIDLMLEKFILTDSDVGTLIKKIDTADELFNPNCVKVILDTNERAIYFSRQPIPFIRDVNPEHWLEHNTFWKHIGIYAYRNKVLEQFVRLRQSKLEKLEKLEQLRLLESNYKFFCVETDTELIGIDTAEDLERVVRMLAD